MKQPKAIKTLLPLLKLCPWVIPVIIFLGILSSISEGLGISLLIPFLQNLSQTTYQSNSGNSFVGFLNRLFIQVPSNERFFVIPLCILSCIILKNCLSFSYTLLSSWLYWHVNHRLTSKVFEQLLSVSYSFLDSNESGKLLNTLHTQSWRTCEALSLLVSLIMNACTICVFVIFLMLTSWQLTVLVAVCLTLISLSIERVTRGAKKLGQKVVQANDRITILMLEGFTGMRVIRAFGNESYEQKRFEQASEQLKKINMKLATLYAITGPLSEILSVALLVGILIVALQNKSNIATLLTFIFMLYRLQPSMRKLDSDRVNLVGLTASVNDVMSLLNSSDKPYIRSGRIPFQGLQQAISFESVTFHYNSLEKPVIKNITFCIPRGKTIALVGPSGAGKSTLISLLYRFYDVTQGEIYVDGCPLQQLNLTDWRRRIAIVSQDVYVFSTTVGENIAYGSLNATEDEIIAAAKLANADEFISKFPQGYDTKVGDRGIRLSGGQRQRIALARAIIRNPEILILDEATNALDSASEHLIQEALNTFSKNRTVVVVAHRLSTIKQADQIIVLQDGQNVEQGNFQQLLKLNGLFAKLYQLQYQHAQT